MGNIRWIYPLFAMLLTSFSSKNIVNEVPVSTPIIVTHTVTVIMKKDLHQFMIDMARRESNNHYRVVNNKGKLGKYQFDRKTLHAIGFNVPDSVFLNDSLMQDSAMIALIKHNDRLLRPFWKYRGTYVNGIYITRSGLLAGAHLVGVGGVETFFDPSLGYRTEDSNGTSVEEYIELFANYNIRF